MKNLTIIQKVALTWLKNVDSSLVYFKLLKDFSFRTRLLVYIGLIGYIIFALIFASSFISFAVAPGASVWQLIGSVIFYGTITGMILILTLESVYKLDVDQTWDDIKAQKRLKKEQKLQRWRLRNMNMWMRIFVYIFIYIFFLLIIEVSALGAYIDIFGMAPNNEIIQTQKELFESEYNKFVQWYTFIYLISGLTLDYFVAKKRAAREVQHV